MEYKGFSYHITNDLTNLSSKTIIFHPLQKPNHATTHTSCSHPFLSTNPPREDDYHICTSCVLWPVGAGWWEIYTIHPDLEWEDVNTFLIPYFSLYSVYDLYIVARTKKGLHSSCLFSSAIGFFGLVGFTESMTPCAPTEYLVGSITGWGS